MKGEIVKLILQTISENPTKNVYESLKLKGYVKTRAYSYLPRLVKLGYLTHLEKGKFTLTDKGKSKLNRFLHWISCPMCGSRVRLNGKRNGTGHQRYLCTNPNCHFTFTQTCKEEALMRVLKKKKRVIFILHSNERFSLLFLQRLKEWLKSDELGYLAKDIALIVP
jgi:predicted transcriptional regulator